MSPGRVRSTDEAMLGVREGAQTDFHADPEHGEQYRRRVWGASVIIE